MDTVHDPEAASSSALGSPLARHRHRSLARSPAPVAPDGTGRTRRSDGYSLAADLGSMTKLEPQRFARLALAIPESADPSYARAILQNLADTRPPGKLKNPEKWQAATVEEIEGPWPTTLNGKDDRDFATALCWTIIGRSDEVWSETIHAWLTRTAMSHPHPREDEYTVYSGLRPERCDWSAERAAGWDHRRWADRMGPRGPPAGRPPSPSGSVERSRL
jgi:hypothetical protein